MFPFPFALVTSYFCQMLACFVDDDEAYDKYQREPESESGDTEQNANGNATEDGPSTLIASADVDDDDELDMDELDELEASLSKTSIQIKELGAET